MKRPVRPTWLALTLLLAAAGCGGGEETIPGTLADARAQAAARGVPVLLDFFTDW